MLSKYDFEISLAAWLGSIAATFWFPPSIFVVAATSFNLWHQRKTLYEAGREFEARVKTVLDADWQKAEQRIAAVEKSKKDVVSAQNPTAAGLSGYRKKPNKPF